MAARFLTAARMMDALLGALAQALPDRIPAANDGGPNLVTFSGVGPDDRPFVVGMGMWGNWGGRQGLDGIDGVSPLAANVSPSPVEFVEREGVFQVERVQLVPDSGGPGQWRGGLAIVAEYRLLIDRAEVQLRSSRRAVLPYGLAGGQPGTASSNVRKREGESTEEVLPACARPAVHRHDVIRHVTAGGGGYGDPFARAPEAVLADFVAGKVTAGHARAAYRVVIDEAASTVDGEATASLRAGR
jgi:N-methylhydantoinase B